MSGKAVTADEIIAILGMQPHPEGGYYVETYRHQPDDGGRGVKTGIFYLLRSGDRSHWHRVDAVEMWHWHAGCALELSISTDGRTVERHILGMGLAGGQRPQAVVPLNAWQSARPLPASEADPAPGTTAGNETADWVLVGCTVSPNFEFSGFEMAPPDWQPGRS